MIPRPIRSVCRGVRAVAASAFLAILAPAACTPDPESAACPDEEVMDEEFGGCVPGACGTGTWGDIARDADTVHVALWGSDDGGDGSSEHPFRTIRRAADEAGDDGGGLVALGAGTWRENLDFGPDHRGVEVAGRCRELTTIDGSGADRETVSVRASTVVLRDLSVTGGQFGVWVQEPGIALSELEMHGVTLAANAGAGLLLANPTSAASLHGCEIRDGLPLPDGNGGQGINLRLGATLVADGLRLDGNQQLGIYADGQGTALDLQDTTIRGTVPNAGEVVGRGIHVQGGADLSARGLLLEENTEIGLAIGEPGTTVDLEDTTIVGTRPAPDGRFGHGIEILGGAALSARRLVLDANHNAGILVGGLGTSVDLGDATIRGTLPQEDGLARSGIQVQDRAALVATDLFLDGNTGAGLTVGWEASADVLRVTVLGSMTSPAGIGGGGVYVQDGGLVSASDLLLDGNQGVGLLVNGPGTAVTLQGATIRDTRHDPRGLTGRGIEVQAGGSLEASGLLLESNIDVGLLLVAPPGWDGPGVVASLVDATIRDTQPRLDGEFGRGVEVEGGSALVAERLLLEGNSSSGIVAAGSGSSVDLVDVRILGTLATGGSADGIGIAVQAGASATIDSLVTRDNDGPSIYVLSGGAIEAWDADLTGSAFAGAVVGGGSLALFGGAVSDPTFHPSEGGGVGIFGGGAEDWGPPSILADGVSFSGLTGPAFYLRGPGRYVMQDCSVRASGTWPWLPGGVLALEGVGPWEEGGGDDGLGTGLLIAGNAFDDLPGDAILLDSSSATLDVDHQSGGSNQFGAIGGAGLVWQHCGSPVAPAILDDSLAGPSCEHPPRSLGPLLTYDLLLTETEAVE